jgi:hypothetical protein
MGGRMGGRMETVSERRRRRERMAELDDCSTLCFPQNKSSKKKSSNMEAEQGPQRQSMGKSDECGDLGRQSMGKTDECGDLGRLVIGTVSFVFLFCK